MKTPFGMSLSPSHYADELVGYLGFKEPSLCWEDMILEYLGLQRKSYSGDNFYQNNMEPDIAQNEGPQIKLFNVESDYPVYTYRRTQHRRIDAFLKGKTIFVDSDFPLTRRRLSTCHEIGHFYLPWHKNLTYYKDGCLVEPQGAGQYELDANRFAADLLMPQPFFRNDMDSLPFGLESVERLSDKYLTSLEATARQYVDLSCRSCALVIVEALADGTITQSGSRHKVRYHKRSRSFNHFIQPGTEIATDSPIAQSSLGPGPLINEIPGWELGLPTDQRFIIHCKPWGNKGDVLVLVEEQQGNQGKFLFGGIE